MKKSFFSPYFLSFPFLFPVYQSIFALSLSLSFFLSLHITVQKRAVNKK